MKLLFSVLLETYTMSYESTTSNVNVCPNAPLLVIVLLHQNDDIKLCSNAKSNCYSEHMFRI